MCLNESPQSSAGLPLPVKPSKTSCMSCRACFRHAPSGLSLCDLRLLSEKNQPFLGCLRPEEPLGLDRGRGLEVAGGWACSQLPEGASDLKRWFWFLKRHVRSAASNAMVPKAEVQQCRNQKTVTDLNRIDGVHTTLVAGHCRNARSVTREQIMDGAIKCRPGTVTKQRAVLRAPENAASEMFKS